MVIQRIPSVRSHPARESADEQTGVRCLFADNPRTRAALDCRLIYGTGGAIGVTYKTQDPGTLRGWKSSQTFWQVAQFFSVISKRAASRPLQEESDLARAAIARKFPRHHRQAKTQSKTTVFFA